MRIVITTVQAPFVRGGAEMHAENLKKALINAGHETEIITMPFYDNPSDVIEDYIVASRLMEVDKSWAGNIDLCIGLKFPAYFMPHPNKVIWALHQHRAAYDLYHTEFSNLRGKGGERIQRIIENADNLYLKEAKRIYANSQNVASRMKKFNHISSTPLYHPCPDMEKFYNEKYDNYILMPSRINATKRQLMAIDAMALSHSSIELYIVGKADNDVEKLKLLEYIRSKGVEHRIKYFDFVTQEEKFKLYANAKAVLFIPLDEDYGYITLEAMASSKGVITTTDSGGPLEFVEMDRNGIIAEPTANSIAIAIDSIADSKTAAEEYGRYSKKLLMEMEISWDKVVRELTK